MRLRLFVLTACLASATASAPAADAPAVQFHRDIRPILSNHCFRCHGPDEEGRQSGLRLDTREGLFGAGDSGSTVVTPGDLAGSELYRRITADETERMPPVDAIKPLNDKQIALIRAWIEQGAPWQSHWAYERPQRPALPAVKDESRAAGAVDRFILARLDQEGLAPSERADPVTLVRRLSFDLTGLPPTQAQVDAFVAHPTEAAYAELVETLLASPHFGERMAVHWLDLVRYADSCGYHSDVEQPISPYRDWVIAAFNDNMPFDRFTREQLAGDLLPEPTLAQRIATGYNRLNKTTEEGGAQDGEYLVKSAADRVRTTAGVWLAATLGCAECHDHKYDPFLARDFYSFAAIFADVKEVGVYSAKGRPPEIQVPTPEQAAQQAELAARRGELEARLAALAAEDAAARDELEASIKDVREQQKQLDATIVRTMVTESVAPREMRILPRGNWLDATGQVVEGALPVFLAPHVEGHRVTRLELADWLVGPDNPLTARVFVNRLWRLFFGVGLSKTLDDLGSQGEPPTHPELLDWMAVEFREGGWDMKHMIRQIVTSNTYRQSSIPRAELAQRDPQNRLFARQASWRLDAEFVRDQALTSSGLLVRTIGGRSVKPYQPDGYWEFLNFPKRTWRADVGPNQYRRGLYTHWQRTFLHPSLLAFDATSREECTAQRAQSNTPKAALALLNDPTYVECARVLAARMLQEAAGDDAARIAWGWRTALSRSPAPAESQVLSELLSESRARYATDEAAAQALVGVGQSPRPADLPVIELAAWTDVARCILNLNECVSRN